MADQNGSPLLGTILPVGCYSKKLQLIRNHLYDADHKLLSFFTRESNTSKNIEKTPKNIEKHRKTIEQSVKAPLNCFSFGVIS